MRIMERNKRTVYFCLYDRAEIVRDEYGNETGERRVVYSPEQAIKVSVSAAMGTAQIEQFGNNPTYDKVILTDDMSCPIDENTVLFVDKPPEWSADGAPMYDYQVRRVARSMNGIAFAISKAVVS